MTIEHHHHSPGQPIEVPPAAPCQDRFENLVPLVNALLQHQSGDVVAVCADLLRMAAALASWRGAVDEAVPVAVARSMVQAARRLDRDAESAPGGLQ